ncbi:hypothetical protein CVT25_008658 [Psilocybe cyanescens]|uniref:O-methyltransferase C-terminal domain-containing protein n=1 Tax=Psilocybe cyanescens TaxID=93625 RepID=A0A409XNY7_PSICY|nr:hypothetical protein CVT25_008658 [Psilocybe cyanescens]
MAQPTMLALAKLISESVAKVDGFCVAQGINFPSLDEPFTIESESIKLHPEVSEAVNYIISAAAQLIAILRPVPVTLSTSAIHVHVSSALRVVVDSNVIEILREAGPQGLHVKEISEKNGIDPGKLEAHDMASRKIAEASCVRAYVQRDRPECLHNQSHFICFGYRQIIPGANTKVCRKSGIDYDQANLSKYYFSPEDKFIGTNGIAAYISRSTDESVKSSGFLYEALTHPIGAENSPSPPSPFNLAFKTDLHIFPWLAQEGNEYRLRRFGIALDGFDKMLPLNGISKGYHWDSLPIGSIVVDVGGGVGSEAMKIAQAHPDLKLIVQDTENVVANGIKFFRNKFIQGLTSGQVTFQVHDFFTPNPVTNARVFFLRFILHDWPDATCIQILKNLRVSAAPDTELIINECLIQYACSTETIVEKIVPGARMKSPPSPLLPNLGYARVFDYLIDLQMAIIAHGVERTVEQYAALLQKSGWELKEVLRMPESSYSLHKLVAVPQSQRLSVER